MKIKSKIISISIIRSMLLLSGCSTKTLVTEKDITNSINKKLDKIDVNQQINSAMQYVVVDKFVYKTDSLRQEGIPKVKITLQSNGFQTLEDIKSQLKIPVKIKDNLKYEYLPILDEKDTLTNILNKLSILTNSYWSYQEGVIVFHKTKTVVYKIPLITNDKLHTIYNLSSGSNNLFDVGSITNNIFEELKISLNNVLQEESLTGETISTTTTTYNSSNNNISSLDSSKENQETINLSDKTQSDIIKSNEVSNTEQEQKIGLSKETSMEENGITKSSRNSSGVIPKVSQNTKTDANNSNEVKTASNDLKSKRESGNESKVKDNKQDNKNSEKSVNTRKNENSITKTHSEETNISKKFLEQTDVVTISTESGMIIAKVSRDQENRVDTIINQVLKNSLNVMVSLDLHILEISKTKSHEFKTNLKTVLNNYLGNRANVVGIDSKNGISIGLNDVGMEHVNQSSQFMVTQGDNLLSFVDPTREIANISGLINYLTENDDNKIISQPSITSMPNVPNRIKRTVDIPYIEPEISSAIDSGSLTYSIKFVNDGLDLGVVTNVIDDSVYLSMGVSINQYISDKVISAGTLGNISIPIQAPRVINNSMRIKAGETIFLSGMSKLSTSRYDGRNLMIPTDKSSSINESEIVILATPKIIRFIEKQDVEEKMLNLLSEINYNTPINKILKNYLGLEIEEEVINKVPEKKLLNKEQELDKSKISKTNLISLNRMPAEIQKNKIEKELKIISSPLESSLKRDVVIIDKKDKREDVTKLPLDIQKAEYQISEKMQSSIKKDKSSKEKQPNNLDMKNNDDEVIKVRVKVYRSRVRDKPSGTKSKEIDYHKENSIINVYSNQPNSYWYKIKTNDNTDKYIYVNNVEKL